MISTTKIDNNNNWGILSETMDQVKKTRPSDVGALQHVLLQLIVYLFEAQCDFL